MIDEQGYRLNVGIIVANMDNQLLWCQRSGMPEAWQFPQGGIHKNETPLEAMYRELHEELGLNPDAVEVLGVTADWITYDLPKQFLRHDSKPLCIGQKQRWYLLRLLQDDCAINLSYAGRPEFERWSWVGYWHPAHTVIEFKRAVYQSVLKEFETLLQVK